MNFKKLISSVLLAVGLLTGISVPAHADTAKQTSISSTPSGFAVSPSTNSGVGGFTSVVTLAQLAYKAQTGLSIPLPNYSNGFVPFTLPQSVTVAPPALPMAVIPFRPMVTFGANVATK
jgi:hypothetical protein